MLLASVVHTGTAAAADGHCQAVPEASHRHTGAGATSALPGNTGEFPFHPPLFPPHPPPPNKYASLLPLWIFFSSFVFRFCAYMEPKVKMQVNK